MEGHVVYKQYHAGCQRQNRNRVADESQDFMNHDD
jgi:hypothetical protein